MRTYEYDRRQQRCMEDVYIARAGALSTKRNTEHKLQALCEAAGLSTAVSEGDLTAVKVHFGERGNDAFVNPIHVAAVVREVQKVGAKPFVTDTNTLLHRRKTQRTRPLGNCSHAWFYLACSSLSGTDC